MFEENHIIDPPNQSNTTSSVLHSNPATYMYSVPSALFSSPHSYTSQPLVAEQSSELLLRWTSLSQWFWSSCLGNWFLIISARHISVHRPTYCSASTDFLQTCKERYSSPHNRPAPLETPPVQRAWVTSSSQPNLQHSRTPPKLPRTTGQPISSSASPSLRKS